MIETVAQWLVGKIPAQFLLIAIGLLIASNTTTGLLLKGAWEDIAVAGVECDNAQLESALEANRLTQVALTKAAKERDEAIESRQNATLLADERIATRVAIMENIHAEEIERLRGDVASIPDDDYFCASEPVTAHVLSWMRERAESYNKNRSRRSYSRSLPVYSEEPITILPPD